MKFFEFLERMSSNGFLYYQDNTFSSVHENEIFDDVSSHQLSDIVPFVIDVPDHILTARFSPKYGTYAVYNIDGEIRSLDYKDPNKTEDIGQFLERAV